MAVAMLPHKDFSDTSSEAEIAEAKSDRTLLSVIDGTTVAEDIGVFTSNEVLSGVDVLCRITEEERVDTLAGVDVVPEEVVVVTAVAAVGDPAAFATPPKLPRSADVRGIRECDSRDWATELMTLSTLALNCCRHSATPALAASLTCAGTS